MANRPAIHDLKLHSCCIASLERMEDIKEAGQALHILLGASPFALNVLVNVDSNDWDVWLEAMRSVPAIVKNRCRTIAQLEIISHPGGDLNRFWEAIYQGFE